MYYESDVYPEEDLLPCDPEETDTESYAEESEYDDTHVDEDPSDYVSIPHVWKCIKLGVTILEVSNEGKVKPYKSLLQSSLGYAVAGTPYRCYPVEVTKGEWKNYYVHELVWHAFRGPVPPSWVVRHKRKSYTNALHNLTILEEAVTTPLKI
jgi:hypothetical protein